MRITNEALPSAWRRLFKFVDTNRSLSNTQRSVVMRLGELTDRTTTAPSERKGDNDFPSPAAPQKA